MRLTLPRTVFVRGVALLILIWSLVGMAQAQSNLGEFPAKRIHQFISQDILTAEVTRNGAFVYLVLKGQGEMPEVVKFDLSDNKIVERFTINMLDTKPILKARIGVSPDGTRFAVGLKKRVRAGRTSMHLAVLNGRMQVRQLDKFPSTLEFIDNDTFVYTAFDRMARMSLTDNVPVQTDMHLCSRCRVVSAVYDQQSGDLFLGHSGSSQAISKWDVQTEKVMHQKKEHRFSAEAIALSESYFVSAGNDWKTVIWNRDLKPLATLFISQWGAPTAENNIPKGGSPNDFVSAFILQNQLLALAEEHGRLSIFLLEPSGQPSVLKSVSFDSEIQMALPATDSEFIVILKDGQMLKLALPESVQGLLDAKQKVEAHLARLKCDAAEKAAARAQQTAFFKPSLVQCRLDRAADQKDFEGLYLIAFGHERAGDVTKALDIYEMILAGAGTNKIAIDAANRIAAIEDKQAMKQHQQKSETALQQARDEARKAAKAAQAQRESEARAARDRARAAQDAAKARAAEKERQAAEQRKAAKKNRAQALVGRRVCSTFANGANGWCGYVTQALGDSVRVENYEVFCKKGGLLGICTNITNGSCNGNTRLYIDETYRNPKSIIVPTYCLN